LEMDEESRFARALNGYRTYCWLNVSIYGLLLASGLGVAFLPAPGGVETSDPELTDTGLVFAIDPNAIRSLGIAVALAATVLVILAFLAMKRNRSETAYALHIANIAAGISSCLLTPFCVWLMKEWTRPEFKARYIGESTSGQAETRIKKDGESGPTFKL